MRALLRLNTCRRLNTCANWSLIEMTVCHSGRLLETWNDYFW